MRDAGGVADKFVHRHARARGKVEHGAVDEANSNSPVGCGLDHVALANRIVDHHLNDNAARTPEGATAECRLNIADDLSDDLGKEGHNSLTFAPGLDAGHNKHWLPPPAE